MFEQRHAYLVVGSLRRSTGDVGVQFVEERMRNGGSGGGSGGGIVAGGCKNLQKNCS